MQLYRLKPIRKGETEERLIDKIIKSGNKIEIEEYIVDIRKKY
jgi:hypothetical protein